MNVVELLFGAAGILFSLNLMLVTARVVRNLGSIDRMSLALRMPHSRVQRALIALSGSFVLFAVGMAVGGAGLWYENPEIDMYSRAAAAVSLVGLNYFVIAVERVTRPDEGLPL